MQRIIRVFGSQQKWTEAHNLARPVAKLQRWGITHKLILGSGNNNPIGVRDTDALTPVLYLASVASANVA